MFAHFQGAASDTCLAGIVMAKRRGSIWGLGNTVITIKQIAGNITLDLLKYSGYIIQKKHKKYVLSSQVPATTGNFPGLCSISAKVNYVLSH